LFRLIALVLPLALDTFAISAALGMTRISSRRRLGLGLLFAGFEGGMPLVGLAIGAAVGVVIGGVADYVAIVALAGLGVYMLRADEEKEEERIERFANSTGVALVAVGLAVSLDELAIGFALGLTHVPVVAAVLLIAGQAFIVSQLGFALGRRVGESVREGAETLAGIALIAIAALLLVSKFVRLPI
jgi:manganese efflux pump family protein